MKHRFLALLVAALTLAPGAVSSADEPVFQIAPSWRTVVPSGRVRMISSVS